MSSDGTVTVNAFALADKRVAAAFSGREIGYCRGTPNDGGVAIGCMRGYQDFRGQCNRSAWAWNRPNDRLVWFAQSSNFRSDRSLAPAVLALIA